MQIIVNHLTRMRGERICVAGVDPDTQRHVRPTTGPEAPLTRRLLRENGGPFAVGALIELGTVTPAPSPPETEDHRFAPSQARYVATLTADAYLAALDSVTATSLEAAFPDLARVTNWKYAVAVGRGRRSLAVVRPRCGCRLSVDDSYGRVSVKLRFNDVTPPTYLSVTDLRFVEADQRTVRRGVVEDVDARLRRGTETYLMLGLTRPFADDPEHHWLQLNGICLADRPLGRNP